MNTLRKLTLNRLCPILALFLTLLIARGASAQVQFDGGATIDFAGYTGGGFAPEPAAGQLDSDTWSSTGFDTGAVPFGGSKTSGDAALGQSNGGVNQGGIYAFNVGADNYALGVQPTTADFTPGSFVLRVQNVTGATLTSLDIAYVAYYRNDQPRSNSFNFSWSTTNSNFTSVPALDLVSPQASSGGAWVANPRNTTISGFSVADGDSLYLRWSGADVGGSSNRDEFALDDIVLGTGGDPMGACYSSDFTTCEVTTSDECAASGGNYDGDGTVCPPPTGACCEGANCSGGITESECLSVGGTYRGDDTGCVPGICDVNAGACCISDGSCFQSSDASECCAFGGVFHGSGSVCSPELCGGEIDIETLKGLSDGAPVTLKDVILVTDTDLIASTGSRSLTVQDFSGANGQERGYTIFGSNADIDAILMQASVGDLVTISATKGSFNGLGQLIAPFTGVQTCSATTLPAPVAITIDDMQEGAASAEALESVVVTLSCVTFNDAGGVFAGGANYVVTDTQSSLTGLVRVQTSSLDLAGQSIPSGGVEITGVLSQFDSTSPLDGGYQLLPISINDIAACAQQPTGACCTTPSLGACPTCPGDMNGDNTINLADVADFANALLGADLATPSALACADTDLDGANAINGLDTQAFIALLTSNATCQATCEVLTGAECGAIGGTFHGTGTDCLVDPCNP
ncbi:MAG TPA: DUF5689 domain-containing protein [Phycisphaerae bacterium]|nr:DUF5689 domain-containing protein [Phycisphaerae bacterium]